MIFGFNTDAKCGDRVYHVQSEPRNHGSILETQVFHRGRCVGKRILDCSDKLKQAEFTEQSLQDLLREQHREVVHAIRQGRIYEVIERSRSADSSSDH